MNRKGQVFKLMIITGLSLVMSLLISPAFLPIINEASSDVGGVPGFVILLFPWLILIGILALVIKVLTSGGDFF